MVHKDLFNDNKIKRYKFISWTLFVILLIMIVLTIFYFENSKYLLLILDLVNIGILFFYLGWLSDSSLHHRLNQFIQNEGSSILLKNLFIGYIDNKILDAFRNQGFKYVGYYADSNNINRAEFCFYTTIKKKQFIVEVNNTELKYFHGDSNIEEQDILEDWIILDMNTIEATTLESFAAFVMQLYLDFSK